MPESPLSFGPSVLAREEDFRHALADRQPEVPSLPPPEYIECNDGALVQVFILKFM